MSDTMIRSGSHDDGEIDTNPSRNPTFQSVVDARYSRRTALFGGMTATAVAMFGLSACDSGGDDIDPASANVVNAGAALSTSSGRVVTLQGIATGAAGVTFTPMWTQTSGPAVVLTGANTSNASFIAPSVAASTPLGFRFSASSSNGSMLTSDTVVTVEPAQLGFAAVAKGLADVVAVPAGYSVGVLYRLGDPINTATSAYANTGVDGGFGARAGDHHDGMSYFGLAATGNTPDLNSNTRGMLLMNHENISQRYLHPNGATNTAVGQVRPEAEALKEIECHGVSAIEVVRAPTGGWSYVQASPLNRRITPNTPMAFNGPVRGNALIRTRFSPAGTDGRGTVNNCANGYMPWGDYVTCEENWAGYFRRDAGDNANRSAKSVAALNRYGVTQGARGAYSWSTVVPADPANTTFAKWNATANPAAPADGTGDFRNEPNQYGWCVEIDPYNPTAAPRKRTALGRFGHEGAWPSNVVAGRRPAIYMGDDSRNEYVYKFVSAQPWVPADAGAADRLAVGDKYLDAGVLYVARFNPDGSGQWLPLVFGQGPVTPANPTYAFADQADVLVNTRLAADAVGATRMDRPEWAAVNPRTGEVYITLTNNTAALRPITATDPANPRFYTDTKVATGDQINMDPPSPPVRTIGNANGHIIRLREAGDTSEAVSFTWDIYAFGAGSDLDPANINISGLDATNDFSSPDGLWFARPSNASGLVNPLLWIQTDDGAYTDITNCMMLAAMPGTVGDGAARTITNTNTDGATRTQATIVGRAPGMQLRRFLVGPKECEITGIDSTPDGRTLFVNIQHPGEDTQTGFPNTFPSNWPASQTQPTAVSRPRSSTIVITKDDGGVVGL